MIAPGIIRHCFCSRRYNQANRKKRETTIEYSEDEAFRLGFLWLQMMDYYLPRVNYCGHSCSKGEDQRRLFMGWFNENILGAVTEEGAKVKDEVKSWLEKIPRAADGWHLHPPAEAA